MFYENVKELCHQHRTNITSLVKELGMSTSLPTKWKSGSNPNLETVQKIADYFGVSVDTLLGSGPAQDFKGAVVSGSSIVTGNSGNVHSTVGGSELSQMEAELLRIYRALPVRGQMKLMNFAISLEDETEK